MYQIYLLSERTSLCNIIGACLYAIYFGKHLTSLSSQLTLFKLATCLHRHQPKLSRALLPQRGTGCI